ncbi:MAG: LPS export ABC transporter periplasmic protein LptC [Sphingomonadales bacterium]|nr:LPS export ABC transporter periplasmic protein LptC [Sphingomonadales bacterium]
MTLRADLLRDRRRVFATPGSSHDRIIHLLGAVLPAGVGVVAAAMVITPLFPRSEVSFLLDRNRVAVTSERLKVADAVYRGLDQRMRPFSITAQSAIQHSARLPVVALSQLFADLQLADGPARLTAPSGDYNMRSDHLLVHGPVDFLASDGYHMVTSAVDVDLRTRTAQGSGGVSGTIPSGTFSADRISADLATENVVLEGHARLRMVPGKLRMPK